MNDSQKVTLYLMNLWNMKGFLASLIRNVQDNSLEGSQ